MKLVPPLDPHRVVSGKEPPEPDSRLSAPRLTLDPAISSMATPQAASGRAVIYCIITLFRKQSGRLTHPRRTAEELSAGGSSHTKKISGNSTVFSITSRHPRQQKAGAHIFFLNPPLSFLSIRSQVFDFDQRNDGPQVQEVR